MQPPRVQEENLSPPRVETTRTIQQTKPVAWESVESEEDTHTGISAGHGDTNRQTNREQERNNNASHYITHDNGDAPAHNTRALRRTLTQELIFSCMSITSNPETPKNFTSRKSLMKLLCEIAGAVLDGNNGELLEYRHLCISPKYRQI